MKLIIHSSNLEVSPAIKEHLTEKLSVIEKHFNQIIQINVRLVIAKAHEKDLRQKCELSLHALGKDLFAETHHADLYQSIDLAVARLDKQILKLKEITKNHHHPISAKHISAIAV